ncbi:unnamed protein product [Phytophthora fragariaefolia]|uniref:Unnamed protein product n=1 Tax=Phytophthora fragariaefolia TaxID=1490495 RepID=A0A9W6TR02_9STRA|nr:unnamed protein product [Phytophthora fragariaefolia]
MKQTLGTRQFSATAETIATMPWGGGGARGTDSSRISGSEEGDGGAGAGAEGDVTAGGVTGSNAPDIAIAGVNNDASDDVPPTQQTGVQPKLAATAPPRDLRPTTDYQHVRMEYERGAENLPVDTNMSTGSPNAAATHVAREDCPHLADPEMEALQRLLTVIGEAAVATMLRRCSRYGVDPVHTARGVVETPREQLRWKRGRASFRWLVEVDTAIKARRIVDPLSKIAFAMSCLGGRAKCWAYGRRLTGPMCFSTYGVFKQELRQVFKPPQNEFRSRAAFLDLQQGKHDVHAYAQRAWYLVSNIVTNPIDEATTVVTFMKGLRDGPVTSYLFQAYPIKKLRQPVGAGPPAGDAVERVDIGHAVSKTAAPSESHSHCKKKVDKPNLVILKVNSKRESSLRALADCGASNNFVRLQSLARLDFEEVEVPRSLLEVRLLATGVVVKTEKKFLDELIVLDLDDKFDMVLGMPWLARHDPVIDWAKRTIVRFRCSCATESGGPVGAAHAPPGACDPPSRGSARRGCLRSFRANTID